MSKETEQMIEDECEFLRKTLIEKNRAYGDSAIDPVRIFSKATPTEQLLVRIDDKLSRIARGKDTENENILSEDVTLDLMGYLVLYRIAAKKEQNEL